MDLLFTEISTCELRKLQKYKEDYENLYKRTLELEQRVINLEDSNHVLSDFLEEWKMKYFRAQDTINSLVKKNDS
jgi:hypothetical protein